VDLDPPRRRLVLDADGARRLGAHHRFGAIQTVGPDAGFADIATAIANNGRGYVAWGTQDLGEEANQPFRVYAAVKPAGSTAVRPGVQLDDGGGGLERPVGDVSIAVAPNADAAVAWSGVRTSRSTTGDLQVFYPVFAAGSGAGARFGAAQPVAGGNGAVGGVTVSGSASPPSSGPPCARRCSPSPRPSWLRSGRRARRRSARPRRSPTSRRPPTAARRPSSSTRAPGSRWWRSPAAAGLFVSARTG
jgi:hypothetical protein